MDPTSASSSRLGLYDPKAQPALGSSTSDPRFVDILKKIQQGQQLNESDIKVAKELFTWQERRIAQLRADIGGYEAALQIIHQKTNEKEAQFNGLRADYDQLNQGTKALSQAVEEKEKLAKRQLEELEKNYEQLKESYKKLNDRSTEINEELKLVKQQLISQVDNPSDLTGALAHAGKEVLQGASYIAQSLVSIVSTEALSNEHPLVAFHKNLTLVIEGCTEEQMGTLATALLPFCGPLSEGRLVLNRWSWERERKLDEVHKDFSTFMDCLEVEVKDRRPAAAILEISNLLADLLSWTLNIQKPPEKESTTKWKDTAIRWSFQNDSDADYKAFMKSLTPAIKNFDRRKLSALARAFINLILEQDWILLRGMWKANQSSEEMGVAFTQFCNDVWLELKDPLVVQAKFILLLDKQADYEGVYAQIQRLIDQDQDGEIAQAAIQGYFKSPYFQKIGFEQFLEHFKNLKLLSWTAISKWVAEVTDCEQKLQMYANVRSFSDEEIEDCAQALKKQFESNTLTAAYFKQKKESQSFKIVNQALSLENRTLCAQIASANKG